MQFDASSSFAPRWSRFFSAGSVIEEWGATACLVISVVAITLLQAAAPMLYPGLQQQQQVNASTTKLSAMIRGL